MAEPKQERATRTRELILRAAAEVFDESGYSGAGISKIMNRAGVTQGACTSTSSRRRGRPWQ
ncbi:TetR family transcriptional regulator [Streptomyces flaveolus]|uniref:TetR family transcriptional regulator n=1 Tax=Streptomyces flaveolus TaxID=67297 RepID=UPI0033340718